MNKLIASSKYTNRCPLVQARSSDDDSGTLVKSVAAGIGAFALGLLLAANLASNLGRSFELKANQDSGLVTKATGVASLDLER